MKRLSRSAKTGEATKAQRQDELNRFQSGQNSTGNIFEAGIHCREEIASGGQSIVYRAETKDGLAVALKVNQDGDERTNDLMRREAELLRMLSPHPNIVRLLGEKELAGMQMLALELIDGHTLQDEITDRILPWERAQSILMQLCDALRVVHAMRIVHRDVKPPNVLLAKNDGEETIKLIDFTLAKSLDDETRTLPPGTVAGTATYMAPEQVFGIVDLRSDIYSLGVLMYRMFTGFLPFMGKSSWATIQMHQKQKPIAPSRRNLNNVFVPAELDGITLGLLEKKPGLRPSLDETQRAIERCRFGPVSLNDDGSISRELTPEEKKMPETEKKP